MGCRNVAYEQTNGRSEVDFKQVIARRHYDFEMRSTELLFFITYFFEMPGELFSITITKIIFRELVMAVIPSVTGGLRPPGFPAEFWNFFLFLKKVDFWNENTFFDQKR